MPRPPPHTIPDLVVPLALVSRQAQHALLARALYARLDATDATDVPIPRSLLVAFLQVLGYTDDRLCMQCGTRIIGRVHRQHRAYCSDACRSQAYRQRQRQAHALAAQAVPLATIAATLDTDVPTIQGWLAHPPPGHGPRGRPRQRTEEHQV